jgi:hypothetical protein
VHYGEVLFQNIEINNQRRGVEVDDWRTDGLENGAFHAA